MNCNTTHYRANSSSVPGDPTFTQGGSALVGEDFEDYPFTSVRHWGENSHLPSAPSQRWTLRIRDAVPDDTGILQSASLTLYGTRLAIPAKISNPAAQTLATGSTLVLRAAFTGGNLSYEWQRNGQPIPGANAAEYRLENFTAKAAGAYTCKASNILGIAYATATATLDDTPRAVLTTNSGAPDTLDFNPFTSGQIALWKVTGLPSGMTLDPVTGLVSGRPVKPGAYKLLVTATATDGTVIRVPLTYDVAALPAHIVGNYVAHVGRDESNSQLGGFLSLKIAPNGAATGSVTVGRSSYSFSGFVGDGEGGFALELVLAKPRLRLAFEVDGDGAAASTVTGILTSSDAPPPPPFGSGSIYGARTSWHAKTKPATAYVGSTAAAFFPETENGPPLGAAIMTFKVAADGRATWLITPSDGSPALTGSAPLTDAGVLLAYSPYANSLGSFHAHITAPSATAPALATTGYSSSINWARRDTSTLADPDGFGATIFVPCPGSGLYVKPASGVRILGRSSDTDPLHATLAGLFEELPSTAPLSTDVTATASNALKVAAPNAPKLALAFAAATGRITGSHALSGPVRTARVTAVVLPHAETPAAVGFSFAPSTAGTPAQSEVFRLAPPVE